MKHTVTAFFLVLTLLASNAFAAQGWTLSLSGHAFGPPLVVGIDKAAQRLLVLERQSPFSLAGQFTCTTGQRMGDKAESGDLRTPEGIYFVEERRTGLDYDTYGNKAFTLNFPNPVDRIRNKTGYGIWIHGRGHDIAPRETKGCVALNMKDLDALEPRLERGVPVVIANTLAWERDPDEVQDVTARTLATQVREWAQAWSERSDAFFSFYDPARYAKAQEQSFRFFKSHKKKIFTSQPWIEVMVDELHVLPGPDYWVTWFNQYYRTESIATQGVKRLYWQKDAKGRLRIVGREWDRTDLGLEAKYLDQAKERLRPMLEGWRKAWLAKDMKRYLSYYAPDAAQGARKGAKAIGDYKAQTWREGAPVKVGIEDVSVAMHAKGLAIAFIQRYQDGRGYADVGKKTLVVSPVGAQRWLIQEEEWRPLQQ
ncbi:MAG: L,D-transpeptidase family protein [Desulfovibrionaceae bacterium]